MKNNLLIIGIVCLLLTAFTFAVSADGDVIPPTVESEQTNPQMPQGERPQGNFQQGQPPQGERGQMPAGGMGEMPDRSNMEQTIPAQTDETNAPQESTQEDVQTEQPDETGGQIPEMNAEGNMPQRGEFNPSDMGNFPFGQQNTQATENAEKPYEKWITPIISAVLMIFGYVFVALYKRKQY